MPHTVIATITYYVEASSSLLILVILVFILLTAARESFKHDLETFGQELKLTADRIDLRITQLYAMTITELEIALLKDSGPMINRLRSMQGLPELAPPPEIQAPGKDEPSVTDESATTGAK